ERLGGLSAPRKTAGVVEIPLQGHGRTIAMDGQVIWQSGHAIGGPTPKRHADVVKLKKVKGAHTFAVGA
ncbi:MAG: hypothetical protein WB462_02345, partial [Solirubrobacterales bacterium]